MRNAFLPLLLAVLVVPGVVPHRASGAEAGTGSLEPVAPYFEIADRVVVQKSSRRLYLMHRGRVIGDYPVRLGLSPRGHKLQEGDFRTPEGLYRLSRRNPNSQFFLSIEISYPNDDDMRRARVEGVPPGGLIMIHGQPNVPRKPAQY
jgi:murein L,D-transpeptidase YafK